MPSFRNLSESKVSIMAKIYDMVNIDEEPQLAAQERIEVIPTLVLYRDGEAIGSIVAPESKAAIDAFIQESLGK